MVFLINFMFATFLPPLCFSFDIRKAEAAACIARDSYYDDDRHDQTLESLGFVNTMLFEDDHLQVTVGSKDIKHGQDSFTLIAVVFRGSDEGEDWLHNIDFRLTRHLKDALNIPYANKLKVHRGFFRMVKAFERGTSGITVKSELVEGSLADILNNSEKIEKVLFWLIGHSLGGALATVFASRLSEFYLVPPNHIQAYTFGAPPVGNRHLARYHDVLPHLPDNDRGVPLRKPLNVFRLVNVQDPVPGFDFDSKSHEEWEIGRLPCPPYRKLGLHHFGHRVVFSPRRNPEFFEIYQQLTGEPYSDLSFKDVHFMPAYLAGIRVLCSSNHNSFSQPQHRL